MKKDRKRMVKRGQIYWVDLGKGKGSEIENRRPCVVIQNDIGNTYSPTTIVVPVSHRISNKNQPTQVTLAKYMQEKGLEYVDGVAMAEQIKTIDKTRILSLAGALLPKAMDLIDKAIMISVGLKK